MRGLPKELLEELRAARRQAKPPPCGSHEIRIRAGNVHIRWQPAGADPDKGPVIFEELRPNLITAGGESVARDLWLNSGPAPNHIAVGTGSAPTSYTGNVLETEVFRALISRRGSNPQIAVFRVFITPSDANGFTLREMGLFAGTSYSGTVPLLGGTMVSRVLITPVVKTSAVQLTLAWLHRFSSV